LGSRARSAMKNSNMGPLHGRGDGRDDSLAPASPRGVHRGGA
jgi:hypothetical protein